MKAVLADKRTVVQSIVIAFLFIIISIPCFGMTGKILLPISIALFGSVAISALCLKFYCSEVCLGLSMVHYNVSLLLYVIVKELSLQIEADFVFEWIEFFYFDKLLIAGTIWFGSSVFVSLRRLKSKTDSSVEYRGYFKLSSLAFLIFYSFLLLYSFVLLRLKTGDYPFRIIPFSTINEYLEQVKEIPYEVFMMFFGNLFYFTPLGYILYSLVSEKRGCFKFIFLLVFPLVMFSLLEFSQFFFQNGYCEFDDMLMNSLGFWIGVIMCYSLNKVAYKLSEGHAEHFWN
ncbi:MAG: VanZ family protein [Clostridia bacterium]|nr:VanZ family protein [Clostridia bacterium]